MHSTNTLAPPTRLGTVENVEGATLNVRLPDDVAHGLMFVAGEGYRVGQVGSFVRIPAGYLDLYGIVSQVGAAAAPLKSENVPQIDSRWLRVELVGEGRRGGKFERGISQYPSVGDPVHVVTESDLKTLYAPGEADAYVAIGRVASAQSISAYVDLNRLVSRHSAVLGSTGSGKSTAVASLLGSISDSKRFPAARVVLLDLHGEYASAFGEHARVFRIGANTAAGEHELRIPYWALTCDELVTVAMGTVTGQALTVVQEEIIAAKRLAKPSGRLHKIEQHQITVDSPLPFSIHKLWLKWISMYTSTHIVSSTQNQSNDTRAYLEEGVPPVKQMGDAYNLIRPKFKPESKAEGSAKIYLNEYKNAVPSHIAILEAKLRDPRMQFLFCPGDWHVKEEESTEADLDALLRQWIGADKPISVFDLSAIPSAVLDDLVGALLRILYDAAFWGRMLPVGGRNRPLLIVLEEAHAYLGKQADSATKGRAARAARRIAKEGRKYGVGLMLVSQRPSEIDDTVLSQCGTLFALRLTNESDRGQVSTASSDNLKGLFGMLPVLRTGEALIVGEAVNLPVRALIDLPSEAGRPNSHDPFVVVPPSPGDPKSGWTQRVEQEDYKPLVDAWRTQDVFVNTNNKE